MKPFLVVTNFRVKKIPCPKNFGFFIYPDKSIFTPHHNIIFLGYHTNTQRMIVANDTINKEATMKEVPILLGNFAVCTDAVQYGRSYYQNMIK